MAWVDRQTYWHWIEDRKKASDGTFIGIMPPQPSVKKIDRVAINQGIPGSEFQLAIGVWDDDKYTPINRPDLEFFARQYTFDPAISGARLVEQPKGQAIYHNDTQTWEWKPE